MDNKIEKKSAKDNQLHIIITQKGEYNGIGFPFGYDVDRFQRLYIPAGVLRILYLIGKTERELQKNYDRQNEKRLLDKLERLYNEFWTNWRGNAKMNPYNLDCEFNSDAEDYISFVFYDDEVEYILVRGRDIWRVYPNYDYYSNENEYDKDLLKSLKEDC